MRICKVKATKRIIEMQSAATPGTLLKNAMNAGYVEDAVEELEVDSVGYEAAKAEDPVEIANAQVAEVRKEKIKTAKDSLKNMQIGGLNSVPELREAVRLLLNAMDIEYKI